jgi:hypothetical protein
MNRRALLRHCRDRGVDLGLGGGAGYVDLPLEEASRRFQLMDLAIGIRVFRVDQHTDRRLCTAGPRSRRVPAGDDPLL